MSASNNRRARQGSRSLAQPLNHKEAYNFLRTNLEFIATTDGARSFVVTSATAEEGKSSATYNMACSLAAGGKKVVIVDCDLRKPHRFKYFKLGQASKGLSNVLSGSCELQNACIHLQNSNVYVVPAGSVPPNPSELLMQRKMEAIINVLKRNFDYVILDTPPVCNVADAAVLGHYVDGALMIVRSDYATKTMVREAKRKLEDVNVKIYGVVLMHFEEKHPNAKSKYDYDYDYYGDNSLEFYDRM